MVPHTEPVFRNHTFRIQEETDKVEPAVYADTCIPYTAFPCGSERFRGSMRLPEWYAPALNWSGARQYCHQHPRRRERRAPIPPQRTRGRTRLVRLTHSAPAPSYHSSWRAQLCQVLCQLWPAGGCNSPTAWMGPPGLLGLIPNSAAPTHPTPIHPALHFPSPSLPRPPFPLL